MVTRKIVQIDEELCDGCGKCIPNCVEGAIKIVNGKAKIIKDSYCDGLGACLGYCPHGALSIIEREADEFDEAAALEHKKGQEKQKQEKIAGSPQWPVQLNLVSVEAPYFENADLLLIADCVPIVYSDFHEILVPGKSLLVGCPKFDDTRKYLLKIGEILKRNNVKSLTVAHMEVPCCSGLKWIAEKAVEASNKQIPIKFCIVGVDGEMK
jgi:Fe-S-cluster-containing hydrogenase component 2